MGWFDRRPGKREGSRLEKRFVWYREGSFEDWSGSDEADRYDDLPNAWLDPLVYQALPKANPQFQLYSTWEQVVNALSEGLARMRALLAESALRTRKELPNTSTSSDAAASISRGRRRPPLPLAAWTRADQSPAGVASVAAGKRTR